MYTMHALSHAAHTGAHTPATVGIIPGAPLLLHMPAAEEGTPPAATIKEAGTKESHDSMFFIGAGLPPVPRKLVDRIQTGEFVDMAELLPDHTGVSASPQFDLKKRKGPPRDQNDIKSAPLQSGCNVLAFMSLSILPNSQQKSKI